MMGILVNKKGFELVWNNVVYMILAFFVLLFLTLFFTGGADNFLGNVKGYFSYSNLDSVIGGCNILFDSMQTYSFCCEKKEVKYFLEGEKVKGEFSCFELANENFSGGRINILECKEDSCQ